ncbi:MAG: cobalamin B12-binding domain-containing protein [Candidatus Tectomicrobia bacterium]|uniref:Cobalamin B12-binding domain-containing protein n=1 Tax=Tectimicrobiota bacterium TaxID=2528274 RepID=A0A932FVK1_UNCTE|nr:cobalamin B12-binding domain-containing protein [Candidatus Tectomicrobia bacterium]
MKVVLISAPYFDVYGSLNVGKNHTFSLGVGYLAATLRQGGHEVTILDPEPRQMTDAAVEAYLREWDPDLVGISSATANFKGAQRMATLARRATRAPIVVGGVHASALPLETLEACPQFDLVVVGEGEETLLELCGRLAEGRRDLREVPGLAYRENGSGEVVLQDAIEKPFKLQRTAPRPPIGDLDRLPFPARDLVDLTLYRPQVHLYRGRKSATLITSRGCPARCTFCATGVTLGNRIRFHSPQYVLSEIEQLVHTYGVRDFVFVDDTFTASAQRTKEICQGILDRGLEIGWFCFARVNNASWELFELMKRAGCFSLFFGVESADPQVLKNIKKGTTVEQARQAMKLATAMGFKTEAGFMFGNPGDTRETIEKTIAFALELSPVIGSFNIMVPFPGTEEYERHRQKNPEGLMNWDNYVPKGVQPLIQLEDLSKADLQRYISRAYLKFYLRPRQILHILRNLSSAAELGTYLRGALGLSRRIQEWRKASQH